MDPYPAAVTTLRFQQGTVEVREIPDEGLLPDAFAWDERSRCHRAPASAYSALVMALHRRKLPFEDEARRYDVLEQGLRVRRDPRPYQAEALEAWKKNRGQGVVVLPTGAGKSYLAQMAMDHWRRSTLVVAPTLDLVRQWYDQLRVAFPWDVGVVGGGDYDVQPVTVTTYDSAFIHMENLGNRFGLVVFDECHHLPGASFSLAARFCLAPFRLGLTATPERADGREALLDELIGPQVYGRSITELTGQYLSDYDVERIYVDLSPQEWHDYQEARAVYRDFVMRQGIRVGSPGGWQEFLKRSSMSEDGRTAFKAYLRHKQLAHASPSKLAFVEHLLERHADDRALLFTANNDMAYDIGRRFLLPVITHQTRPTERSEVLAGLREGRWRAVVTSKVLNEGVDVPEANVAVIVSGSGSVREHVQRLGRVLRKQQDKRAILYELIAEGTSEAFTSQRRREHDAYRGQEG